MNAALVIFTDHANGAHVATVTHLGRALVTARRASDADAVAVALIQLGIDLRDGKLDLVQPPPAPRRRTDSSELAASLRALAEEIDERAVTP